MCVYVDYLTGSPCVCTYIIKHVCSYVGVCGYTESRLSLEGLVEFFLPSDILLLTWKIESLCHLGKLELDLEWKIDRPDIIKQDHWGWLNQPISSKVRLKCYCVLQIFSVDKSGRGYYQNESFVIWLWHPPLPTSPSLQSWEEAWSRFCVVGIRALSESSSLEAVAKVAGAHTRPHFIGKERYKKSTREKEKNIKRVQEMRRKTSREYKRWGEKHQ